MYNLGALGYFFIWTIFISGVYLFIFYDVHLGGAYDSVRRLTVDQKYYGGVIRSIHRYASCGLALVAAVHALQTFFSDRFRKYRWLAWVSGVVILPVMWFEGVTGYIMVFDEKGEMAAIQLAGWLDAIPFSLEQFSRNFIPSGTMNSLFFFVLTFLHITLPLVMLVILWIHCMRISRPVINPPLRLAVYVGLLLLLLSVIKPAVSGPRADLAALVSNPEVDWFYLFPFPLADAFAASPSTIGLVSLGALMTLSVMPWVVREPRATGRAAPARVDLEYCTGCEQCHKACPFEAINILPRSDGRAYELEVEILEERCASCGLCLPACPFPAISVGQWTHEFFDKRIAELFPGGLKDRIMLFVCERAGDPDVFNKLENAGILVIPCAGILGASVVTACLDWGADGVVVAGCVEEDCHYRLLQRRLDVTRLEIGRIKRVKTVAVSRFSPDKTLEEIRSAHKEFKGE